MPHVVIDGPVSLEKLFQSFEPFSTRREMSILKIKGRTAQPCRNESLAGVCRRGGWNFTILLCSRYQKVRQNLSASRRPSLIPKKIIVLNVCWPLSPNKSSRRMLRAVTDNITFTVFCRRLRRPVFFLNNPPIVKMQKRKELTKNFFASLR